MHLLISVVLLLLLPISHTLGQTEPWETIQLDCSHTRLRWIGSAPDSTLSTFALDSVRRVVAGRWQLVGISGGWLGKPHPPEHATEIRVNMSGKGQTYINRRRINRFKIILSTRYGYIRCAITEEGTTMLNLNPGHKGRLYICPQVMIISQDLGDGEVFVFKRLTSYQP